MLAPLQQPNSPASSVLAMRGLGLSGHLSQRTFALQTRLAVVMAAWSLIGFGMVGCAEVQTASPQDAEKLAGLRSDREENEVLSRFQQAKKRKAIAEGKDADALYDDAEPLRKSAEFQAIFVEKKKAMHDAKIKEYLTKPASTVQACMAKAGEGHGADEIDNCIQFTPTPEELNPVKAAIIAVLVALLGIAVLFSYRSTRRRADTVAVAAKKLGLTVVQGQQSTVATGTYKDYSIKMESSPPEAGQGDRFMRVIVLSKINPAAVVRFGPVAPPTGLDLPDLEAPEVEDSRLPEGYKLRLSPGASAEELLSGDIGFQLRVFDPVDVRVHDGVCGVTCWQIPATTDKVVEFIDLTLGAANLYKADK